MKRNFGTLTLLVVILMATTIGCDRTNRQIIPSEPAPSDEMMPMGSASDEESAVQLALTDTYDNIRNGAHLIISYDAATDSFIGGVTNTTGAILPEVRVEIHLFNDMGTVGELGPTPSVDLMPGETDDIVLPAMGLSFNTWTAHPEVGPSSAGGGEDDGEHGEGAAGEGAGEGAGGGKGGGEHGQGGEGAEGGGN